jgi:hypothetical protein
MRAPLAVLVLLLSTLLAAPAVAGGVGVFNQTGFHFGASLSESGDRSGAREGGTGAWMDEGGGIELLLGYRKTRLNGRFRLSYAAIIDLDGGVLHAGLVSAGVTVDLLKDLERKVGLYVALDLGVAPLATQLRVFMFADVGVGIRFRPNEIVEVFGELTGLFRYDKSPAGGPMLFLGVRFAFD